MNLYFKNEIGKFICNLRNFTFEENELCKNRRQTQKTRNKITYYIPDKYLNSNIFEVIFLNQI